MTHDRLSSSEYARAILEALPWPSEIIDCHAHMDRVSLHHIPEGGTAASMVEAMDKNGVAAVCCSHHLAITGDLAEGNRRVIEAAEAFPGRFYVYIGFNPNYPVDYLVDMLDRYVDHPSVIGLKFHTSLHNTEPDDDRYRPAYEYARDHGLAILSHIWGLSHVKEFAKNAKEFSTVPFIFGHCGGFAFVANTEAAKVARELPNAYLDLCLSGMFEGMVEYFVNTAGAQKVMYGSDIPFMDPRGNLGRVAFADIPDEAKARVLGLNIKSIIERCGKSGRG